MFLERQEYICQHVSLTFKMKVTYSVQIQLQGGPKNVFYKGKCAILDLEFKCSGNVPK